MLALYWSRKYPEEMFEEDLSAQGLSAEEIANRFERWDQKIADMENE